MTEERRGHDQSGDRVPGEEHPSEANVVAGIRSYMIGAALAAALTAASFYVAGGSSFVWKPGVPFALVALAIAQMGVHLVFFFHITSAPDNTNNVLALAFGLLVVFLMIAGSLWIMTNLHRDMPSIEDLVGMQR